MSIGITFDLKNPSLFRSIKHEAIAQDTAIREIVEDALSIHLAHRLKTKALIHASESVFNEWDNELDSDYDSVK